MASVATKIGMLGALGGHLVMATEQPPSKVGQALEDLAQLLDNVMSDIERLEGQYGALEPRIGTLTTEVVNVETSLDWLQAEQQALGAQLFHLDKDFTAAENDIVSILGHQEHMAEEIDTIDNGLSVLGDK